MVTLGKWFESILNADLDHFPAFSVGSVVEWIVDFGFFFFREAVVVKSFLVSKIHFSERFVLFDQVFGRREGKRVKSGVDATA